MKRKKLTQIISIVLCFLVCFHLPTVAADEERVEKENLTVDYVNISSKSASFSISGLTSTSRAVLCSSSSMLFTIKMELQKLKSGSYSTIETWTNSKTGTSLTMEEDRLINVLSTYRLKVTFTAGSETVISYAYS